ncbi:hypothetical protein [Natronococcus occultus]|uniref:Uncharacterized protein n=1 Tax=Natronococcus occultus SP4 TaxID=694430 RepID=L0K499_9EURY|nr:hypothetical protein [Natronococcus occultus]AGB39365.1 hypothetical protein Natoc_3649 [Natronococcus occultus SP4]
MEGANPDLMEDIDHARTDIPTHLWGAIISAIVSLLIPIVGVVAVYSGYRVSEVMSRRWFGLLFAAVGGAMAAFWLLGLVLWQLGYLGV